MAKQPDEEAPAPPPPPPLLPPCNSLKSRKRLLATPDRIARTSQGASPSSSSIQSRHPNISNCHCCGSRNNPKGGGKDVKLRILDSQWRIVLLCSNCFKDVRSAYSCSYCFRRFLDEERVRCGSCSRCVHKGCVYDFNGACSWSCTDLFTCFDCWEPRSNRKTCCGKSQGLSDVGEHSRSLEDMAKEAVVKIAAAARARDNACKKDEVARRTAAAAAAALDLYRVDSNEEALRKDPLLSSIAASVDNSELEDRLRRAIDSSPRIFKKLCSANADPLVALKILNADGHLSSSRSNPGKSKVCRKLDIVSVTKKPKKAISEFSTSIFAPEYNPCVVLCLPAQRKKVKFSVSSQKKKHLKIGEDGKMGNSVCGTEASLCKITDVNDTSVVLPAKEEQSSSSGKPSDCCRDKVIVDSQSCDKVLYTVEEKKCDKPNLYLFKYSKRTQSHSSTCDGLLSTSKEKARDESDLYLLKYSKRAQCQSSCPKVLSSSEEKGLGETDMYLLKYSKRKSSSNAVLTSSGTFLQSSFDTDLSASQQKICQVPDMYFYKYSKRHKGSSDSQPKFSCEDFPLRSRPQQLEFSCYS